ncbi:unnamed protein product [Durusdinium trenchii]|uniref:Uncharacterized protein n=1 Tax=Durusdinium trenchii TaxID=1381693 RepID=A0ABP0LEM2_9DINO
MLRIVLFLFSISTCTAVECQAGDAICQDQEMPSNSLLQREKRAVGKDLGQATENDTSAAAVNATKRSPCVAGGRDASCCYSRGQSCTNPPNPFDSRTSCPPGAMCSAPLQLNPFAGPSYGFCQCGMGSCAGDGNSCGVGPDLPKVGTDVFATCDGRSPPEGCCPNKNTCTNPPNPFDLSTACGIGQACDAELTTDLTFSNAKFGTCKCMVGTCGSNGACSR